MVPALQPTRHFLFQLPFQPLRHFVPHRGLQTLDKTAVTPHPVHYAYHDVKPAFGLV
jgi:hypothetical protein